MGGAQSAFKRLNFPEAYFEQEIFPPNKHLFSLLGFSYEDALYMFWIFSELDKFNSGQIEMESVYKFFSIKQTNFTDRVFTFMDNDNNGKLDLKEFMIGIWNYSTYNTKLIAKILFRFFDIDNVDRIDMADVDAMLRMLYKTEDSDWDTILSIFGHEGRDDGMYVNLEEWTAKILDNPRIIQPAFDLQKQIRKKTFGITYWEEQTKRREEEFGRYYDKKGESWGGVMELLARKKREKPKDKKKQLEETKEENTNEQKEEKDDTTPDTKEDEAGNIEEEQEQEQEDPFDLLQIPEEDELYDLQKRCETEIRKEKMAFNEDKLQAMKEQAEEEDEAERQAYSGLDEAKKRMENSYTLADLDARIDARKELWDAVDPLKKNSRELAKLKEEIALQLARGPDAENKLKSFLLSPAGQKKLDFETMRHYGIQTHHFLNSNLVTQIFASGFEAPEGKYTLNTKMAYQYLATGRAKDKARRAARLALLEEYKEIETELTKKTWADRATTREQDFLSLTKMLIIEHGSRNTKWEKLYLDDPYRQQQYNSNIFYLHIESREMHYGEQAICERCDTRFLPEDVRCITCQAPRNWKNKKLFGGN